MRFEFGKVLVGDGCVTVVGWKNYTRRVLTCPTYTAGRVTGIDDERIDLVSSVDAWHGGQI